jgi:hypothetical protein
MFTAQALSESASNPGNNPDAVGPVATTAELSGIVKVPHVGQFIGFGQRTWFKRLFF